MNWLFGNSQAKKDAPKKAITQLRTQRETLTKREQHLQTQVTEYRSTAKKYADSNKQAALSALKRMKVAESQLAKIEGQIDSLNAQLDALESVNLNYETLKSMEQGAKAMKQIHGNMDIDKVEDTMEQIRDQVVLSEEIGDAIARPVHPDAVDDDELLEELEELQQENLDAKMVNAGKAPVGNLPTASKQQAAPEEEEDEEEEELRKLQAEMAM